MRAALYVVGLARRRVERRSSGALLAAVGIAIGTAVLIGVLAGTKIAQDRSVSQAVERIRMELTPSAELTELLDFIASSERGFIK